MGIDHVVRAARPDPVPSEAAKKAHRAALDQAINTAPRHRADRAAVRGDTDVAVLAESARRRRPTWLVVAAAALCVVGLGALALFVREAGRDETVTVAEPAADGGDRGTATTDAATPPVSPGTSAQEKPALQCGTELPFTVEMSGTEAGLIEGPLSGPPAGEGQLVQHVVGAEASVEFRWPAAERAKRGEPSGDSAAGDVVADFSVAEFMLTDEGPVYGVYLDDGTNPLLGPPGEIDPHLRLSDVTEPGTDPACAMVEMRFAGSDGQSASVFLGLDTDLADDDFTMGPVGDTDPVVIETRASGPVPTESVDCDPGLEDVEVPPSIDRAITDAPVAAEPIDALIAFLTGPDGERLYQSGYVEFPTTDGPVTYARAFDGPNGGWVTIIDVEPVDGGWSATRLATPGC